MKLGPPGGSNTGMSLDTMQLAELRDKVTAQQRQLDKQALLLEAMWQFMKSEFELDDDDLKAVVGKLEAAGSSIGPAKDAPPEAASHCPRCEEPVKGVRSTCFWCGFQFPQELFGS